MSRAVLLDASPSGVDGGEDETITLSALAEYACRRDDVAHRDLSAVAPEGELAALQDAYWDDQVEWLRLLERRVAELAAPRGRPIAASAYTLKLLLDGIFIRGFESDHLTRAGWSELAHVTRPHGPALLGEVLPRVCAARGVAYSRIRAEAVPRPRPSGARRADWLREAVVRNLRSMAAGSPRGRADPDADLRLMFLNSHYDSADLLRRNARCGSRSLLLVRDRVIELRRGAPRSLGKVSRPSASRRDEWREFASALRDDEELWAWPSSWFEGAIGGVVAEHVTDWLANSLPSVLTTMEWFASLLDAAEVDAVVAPFLAEPLQVGAFTAACAHAHAQAVLIEHGDIAHAAPSWDLNLLSADLYVVPTMEIAQHLEARRGRYPEQTAELLVGSYRWPRYARLCAGRRRGLPATEHGTPDAAKPTLIYLVTALAGDSRYLNNAWYPDAWYFGLQAAIVSELDRHDGYNVVVKLFPATEHDESPLGAFVSESTSPHVMVSRAPFAAWMPHADRVVVDMASTGLYEALVAGLPAMGLLWSNHAARPAALRALGPALQPFTTYADAAAAVGRFAAVSAPAGPGLTPEGADIRDELLRALKLPVSVP